MTRRGVSLWGGALIKQVSTSSRAPRKLRIKGRPEAHDMVSPECLA